MRLRQGRKVGRTLYRQLGAEPSDDDVLVGLVDTPELAAFIVAAAGETPAQNPVTPMVVGADGRAAETMPPHRYVAHEDGWEGCDMRPIAARHQDDRCDKPADDPVHAPPAQQPAGPCPTCQGRNRHTVDMVCMDCGRDYMPDDGSDETGPGLGWKRLMGAWRELAKAREAERDEAQLDARNNLRERDAAHIEVAARTVERDAARAEVERLRAGEDDTLPDEAAEPTPGQWIRWWNELPANERLRWAARVIDNGATASACFMRNHERQLDNLQRQLPQLVQQRDAARGLAAALEAELARVQEAVSVGATPALIAEILDEGLDA